MTTHNPTRSEAMATKNVEARTADIAKVVASNTREDIARVYAKYIGREVRDGMSGVDMIIRVAHERGIEAMNEMIGELLGETPEGVTYSVAACTSGGKDIGKDCGPNKVLAWESFKHFMSLDQVVRCSVWKWTRGEAECVYEELK